MENLYLKLATSFLSDSHIIPVIMLAGLLCCQTFCVASLMSQGHQDVLQQARDRFQDNNRQERAEWLLAYMKDHSVRIASNACNFTWIIGTFPLCAVAWCRVLGISDRTFQRMKGKFIGKYSIIVTHLLQVRF